MNASIAPQRMPLKLSLFLFIFPTCLCPVGGFLTDDPTAHLEIEKDQYFDTRCLDCGLREVFRKIGEKSGYHLIVDGEVKEQKINLELFDCSLKEHLQFLGKLSALYYLQDYGRRIWVFQRRELSLEKKLPTAEELKYANKRIIKSWLALSNYLSERGFDVGDYPVLERIPELEELRNEFGIEAEEADDELNATLARSVIDELRECLKKNKRDLAKEKQRKIKSVIKTLKEAIIT